MLEFTVSHTQCMLIRVLRRDESIVLCELFHFSSLTQRECTLICRTSVTTFVLSG